MNFFFCIIFLSHSKMGLVEVGYKGSLEEIKHHVEAFPKDLNSLVSLFIVIFHYLKRLINIFFRMG